MSAIDADRAGDGMGFPLLDNPFVLLNVPIDASREDVASGFDDAIADDIAADTKLREARRRLLAPLSRIEATLGFLPDATHEQRRGAIGALRSRAPFSELVDLAKTLPPVARAIFLSNIAPLRPGSGIVRYVSRALSEIDKGELAQSIERISEDAGLPCPAPDRIFEALDAVISSAAERLFPASDDMKGVAEILSRSLEMDLPRASPELLNAYTIIVNAYDRRASSPAQSLRRQIEEIAAALRADPEDVDALEALDESLREWGTLMRPQQRLASRKERDEPTSRGLFELLRGLTLGLVNEGDAPRPAFAIAAACLEVFADLPRAAGQLKEDLVVLRGLVDELGARDLIRFIDEIGQDSSSLARDVKKSGFGRSAAGQAGKLFVLFERSLAATRGTTAAELPWKLVRFVALDLNNKYREDEASEKIISTLLHHPEFSQAPEEIKALILKDQKTLGSNILEAQAVTLIKNGDRAGARRVLQQLLRTSDDTDQKQQYQRLLNDIEKADDEWIVRGLIWLVIIASIMGLAMCQASVGTKRSSAPSYPTAAQLERSIPNSISDQYSGLNTLTDRYRADTPVEPRAQRVAPTPPDDGETETMPPVGRENMFTRSNLRYCLYMRARLAAVRDEVESGRGDDIVDAFNGAVDDYNSRCGSFRYRMTDMTAVQSEVSFSRATLTAQGRSLIEEWRAGN